MENENENQTANVQLNETNTEENKENYWVFDQNREYIGGEIGSLGFYSQGTRVTCRCGQVTNVYDVYVDKTRLIKLTNKQGLHFTLRISYTGRQECETCGDNISDLEWVGDENGTLKLGYECCYFVLNLDKTLRSLNHMIPRYRTGREMAEHIKYIVENISECPTCAEYICKYCDHCINRKFIFGTEIVKDTDKCSICLDPIRKCDLFTTKCKHHFHIACLRKHRGDKHWTGVVCPMCRSELSSHIP